MRLLTPFTYFKGCKNVYRVNLVTFPNGDTGYFPVQLIEKNERPCPSLDQNARIPAALAVLTTYVVKRKYGHRMWGLRDGR
jgi:hypothetical protein